MPSNQTYNYIGISLAILSGLFYLFVDSTTQTRHRPVEADLNEYEDTGQGETISQDDDEILVVRIDDRSSQTPTPGLFDRMSKTQRHVIGILLACFSGIMYGECVTPVIYTGDLTGNRNYINYLYSFYTGIFLTTLFYFVIYCVVKKNQPVLFPNLILPGLVSGWMWGLADLCYFLATGVLSQAIAFPISNCGPPVFSALWGVLLYKEVRGWKNFALLFAGFFIATLASVLLGLSF